jgi:peptidoglycan/LPS O-acetylase OafA/YrhL
MPKYQKRGEIASLTGLRGLAALLVVITHYWLWARVTPADTLPASIELWTRTAGIGMAIFFTLSGYVIALSYGHWDWRARPAFNLIRLFFYRFARLYPAYLVFVILIILRYPALQEFDEHSRDYLVPHLLLMQSWLPMKFDGELTADGHFHVAWSLSVECALYLAFGLGAILAVALPRWRYKPLLLAIVFFVLGMALVEMVWPARVLLRPDGWSDTDWIKWGFYYSPYAISLQFGIGVAAYKLSTLTFPSSWSKVASDVGAVGLVAIYLLIALEHLRDGFNVAILTSLSTASIMIGARANSVVNRLLSGRAIVYVGTISYSLYLFHFITPPIALHSRSFDVFDSTAAAYHAVNFASSLALAIIFATGVYALVEVPGRKWIRVAADRLLGISRASTLQNQNAPAE